MRNARIKAQRVRLAVFDVDGALTDGGLICRGRGGVRDFCEFMLDAPDKLNPLQERYLLG
jgi:3-deoxy-D-manno-octulosonate 8-phosphate phosphatase KdsC-like HAD superfamily phosphatase